MGLRVLPAILGTCLALACNGGGGSGGSSDDGSDPGGNPTGSAGDTGPGGGGSGNPDDSDPMDPDAAAECDGGERITVVPIRRLSHIEYRRTLADLLPGITLPQTELPDDLAVHGFENQVDSLNPSALLIERYSEVAGAAAQQAVAQGLDGLLDCDPDADLEGCAATFVRGFGLRAFRRPLLDGEVERFTGFLLDQVGAVGFEGAVQLTLEAFLQSPGFLYRVELDPEDAQPGEVITLDDYEVASRLSYLLWQSMPDQELFDTAAAGALGSEDEVEAQARRMLDDERATRALVDFHRQWLDLDAVAEHTKDPDLYPAWSEGLRDAMLEEAERFVELIFDEGHGTLREVLTSRRTEVNAELAALYGLQAPIGGEWEPVELDPAQRSGVLTLPAVMASRARPTNGSPPLRGVFVLEQLLCMRPPPPPDAANTSVPEPPDDGQYTNRQLFEMRTSEPECQGCHVQIDGIGFSFEHYDGIGQWRSEDNGLPVDASGELLGSGDQDGAFDDAIDLMERLAASDRTKSCLATNWFRYARGREPTQTDVCTVNRFYEVLKQSDGDFRELVVAMATSPTFRQRVVSEKN